MTDSITLSLPEDVSVKIRSIARETNQTVEQILLNYLKDLSEPLPVLPADIQDELKALQYLSDDTLWTIARDQMAEDIQNRAHVLMQKNNQEALTQLEQAELDQLVERADRLMLRKAEAASILRKRGHDFKQKDFRPKDA